MNLKSSTIVLFCLSTACPSAWANVCRPDDASEWASQMSNAFYNDDQMAGSCAAKAWVERTNWRDGLEGQIEKFLNDPVHARVVHTRYQESFAPFVLKGRSAAMRGRNFQSEFEASIQTRLKSPEIRKKVFDLANDADCVKGVELSFGPDNGFFSEDFFTEKVSTIPGKKFYRYPNVDIRPHYGNEWNPLAENDPVAIKLLNDRIHEQDDDSSGREVAICSSVVPMRSVLTDVVDNVDTELSGDGFFDDNSAVVKSNQEKLISKSLVEALKPSQEGCVRSIRSVQISTSANAVRNTQGLSAWDFKSLSLRRANALKASVKKLGGGSIADDAIVVGADGENGDGTSGPCPYLAKTGPDGKVRIERITAANFAEAQKLKAVPRQFQTYADFNAAVEGGKYGRVSFEIDEDCSKVKTRKEQNEVVHGYVASQCFSVDVSCRK